MKWTEVWKAPFTYDGYGYIWSVDGVMVFTVDMERDPNSSLLKGLVNDILSVLNGKEPQHKYEHLNIKDGCDLYYGDLIIGAFRGWGHLTGTGGGLGLPSDQAAAIQDEMIQYVLEKLQK